jgi:hypothetical protein
MKTTTLILVGLLMLGAACTAPTDPAGTASNLGGDDSPLYGSLFYYDCHPSTNTIIGVAYDCNTSTNNFAPAQAKVMALGTQHTIVATTYTDPTGSFEFDNLPAGGYVLYAAFELPGTPGDYYAQGDPLVWPGPINDVELYATESPLMLCGDHPDLPQCP